MEKIRQSYFLLLASVLDAIATHAGIAWAGIGEANPLMAFVYEESIFLFYGMKVALPLILIGLFVIQERTGSKSRVMRVLTELVSNIYLYLILFHITWLSLYLCSF